jgi:diaminopropionate ammonia-lyase
MNPGYTFLRNPLRDSQVVLAEDDAPLDFHRGLPGYAVSPLIEAPALAAECGVGRVWLKLELERFGLPAFKFLGASWAARRLLAEREGAPGLELVTATDGNHGRAVARIARDLGLPATILVPAQTAAARIEAISWEGARVELVDGTYDDAVRAAASMAGDRRLLLSDTSWPGYERVPGWVIDGYSTIFSEIADQVDEPPDVAFVPIGVGALAAAAARHFRSRSLATRLVGVEPLDAACMLESVRAGRRVAVPGPHTSIMAGLNAGEPSLVAWPEVSRAFDAFSAIDDSAAEDGMRRLASMDVAAGECAGGAVGAALQVLGDAEARVALGVDRDSSVLLLLTEGVTDPEGYRRIAGG